MSRVSLVGLESGKRILVAVSGGADSLTLLHLLSRQRDELECGLIACHVHHGMRGVSAEADVRFLEKTCREWDIPLEVVRRDVPAVARERRISVEEAGRLARYEAFAAVAEQHGCDVVATAHTADDQAETVMMRLMRGAGLDGLAGIPRRRPLVDGEPSPEVVRPLLHVWRRDIEAYCEVHGLRPRQDVTNLDRRYRRSHLRLELIPILEAHDPHLKRHLVRLAAQAAAEKELLLPEAHRLLDRITNKPEHLVVTLDAQQIAGAPAALARRALRLHLAALNIEDADGEADVIERLLELARGRGARFTLPRGLWRVRRQEDLLVFEIDRKDPAPPPAPLPRNGYLDVPGWGMTFTLQAVNPPTEPRQPPNRVYVDLDQLRGQLVLRAPKVADRFRPLGSPGSRLLSDLFVDRKVRRRRRSAWPVLCDDGGIVWVVGLALADRCRVTAATKQCLLLQVDPLPEVSG